MIVAYSFIGKLPEYSIDTVHQLRLFYDGVIIFIVSDYESELVPILQNKYMVTIVRYEEVISEEFNLVLNSCQNKFKIVHQLIGREKLFIYSFERFFLLYNLMKKFNLDNVFYMELDNLVYDNPEKWEDLFSTNSMAFMYDAPDRYSSGISYFKNHNSIKNLIDYFTSFIKTSMKHISEMIALGEFVKFYDDIQILPTHWGGENISNIAYKNFDKYEDTIFDAAAIGIYLGGVDLIHSDGKFKKFVKWQFSEIDYTIYKYEWRLDDQNRNIPYIQTNEGKWLKINNLHIHSKNLKECLSKPI